jgi:hypothetical protein
MEQMPNIPAVPSAPIVVPEVHVASEDHSGNGWMTSPHPLLPQFSLFPNF